MLGILLKLMWVVVFSATTAGVKYLGPEVPAGQTIFVRSVIAVLVLVLLASGTGRLHLLRTNNVRSHALRSLCGAAGMFLLFAALARAPIADVMAVSYTSPIFVTLLAMVLLGERIRVHRWTAVAIGCAGMLIIVRPYLSFDASHFTGIALAMGSSVMTAFAMVFLRGMSTTEHPITIMFYFSLTTLAGAAVSALAGWPTLSAGQWVVMIVVGVLGTAAQLLLTAAYRYAEASIITPLDYSSMIVAALFGYFLFDEIPGLSLWLGAPLVIASGLLILWREYQLRGSSKRTVETQLHDSNA